LKDIEDNLNFLFVKEDICDKNKLSSVFTKYSPDYVVNFAAESHVDRSIQNPEEFVNTNVLGVSSFHLQIQW
jgi:dTDP-glucose 4,6-dehydratase